MSYYLWLSRIGGVIIHSLTLSFHNLPLILDIHLFVTSTTYLLYISDVTGVPNPNYGCICSKNSLIPFLYKNIEDTCLNNKSIFDHCMFKSNNWQS